MPDLSIVIVNWNSGDLLIKCLQSIAMYVTRYSYEVLLVDNASTDNSLELINENFPELTVLVSKNNIGFSAGNNLALSQCSGKYVLLLNPDTVLIEDVIGKLIDFMNLNPSVGAIGPKLLNSDGTNQTSTAGSFPFLSNVVKEVFGLSKLFPHSQITKGIYLRSEPSSPLEVDWISGACLLVRNNIIQQIGGLDEKFFLYFEDQEWCNRIKKAEYSIFFYPDAKIIHLGNMSISKMTSKDMNKNKISFEEYLLNYNSPLNAYIASKLYFFGLFVRSVTAMTRFALFNDTDGLRRFENLKKVSKIKSG